MFKELQRLFEEKAKVDRQIRETRIRAIRQAVAGRKLTTQTQALIDELERRVVLYSHNLQEIDDLLEHLETRLNLQEY